MAVDVVALDPFRDWYNELDDDDTDAVIRVVDLLAARGVTLPFPFSSAINGSRHAMRELRVQSQGRPLRIFYIFDPKRRAVLILGGDKTGDDRFYETMIRQCDRLADAYLNGDMLP